MLSDLGGRAVSSDDATFLTEAVTRSREPCDCMNDVHVSVSSSAVTRYLRTTFINVLVFLLIPYY